MTSREVCIRPRAQTGGIHDDMRKTARTLGAARARTDALLHNSVQFLEAVAECGAGTTGTPDINTVKLRESRVETLLKALRRWPALRRR